MAYIRFVAIERTTRRTPRRRVWARWTADLATYRGAPQPARPELWVLLSEHVSRHGNGLLDALADGWRFALELHAAIEGYAARQRAAIPTLWLLLLPFVSLAAVLLAVAGWRL